MGFIQNADTLATTPQRKVVLQLIESAFAAIQPHHVLQKNFLRNDTLLTISDQQFDLSSYDRVFVVGFGKDQQVFVNWKPWVRI
jgi:glycerate-2-kinase